MGSSASIDNMELSDILKKDRYIYIYNTYLQMYKVYKYIIEFPSV